MIFDNNQCGARIKREREKAGLTQLQLEDMSGVDHKTIGRIERGENIPTLTNMCRIAAALDTSLDYLVFGVDNSELEVLLNAFPSSKRAVLADAFRAIMEVFLSDTPRM